MAVDFIEQDFVQNRHLSNLDKSYADFAMNLKRLLPFRRREPAADQQREFVHPFRWSVPSDFAPALPGYGAYSPTGEEMRLRLLTQNPMASPLCIAAIRIIAESITAVRFELVNANNIVQEHHPANTILNDGAQGVSRQELAWTLCEGMLVAGNAIIIPQTDQRILIPHWENVRLPTFANRRYEVSDRFNGQRAIYAPDAVAHIRYRRSVDGVNGIGLITQLVLSELNTDTQAQQYTLSILSRMGVPGLVFVPKFQHDDDIVLQEDLDAIERAVDQLYTGAGRGGAMATRREWSVIEPQGVSGRGIDLTAVRALTEQRILAALGVPLPLVAPHQTAGSGRYGRALSELRAVFVTDTVAPLAEHIAEQLTSELLPFYERTRNLRYRPNFEHSELMQEHLTETRQKQANYLVTLVNAGILTVAEARAQLPKI